jgi:hypothetical protein
VPLIRSRSHTLYRIAGNFGGELDLMVWWIDQPTAKLKSANIKSFLYFAHAKVIAHREVTWWVLSLALAITSGRHMPLARIAAAVY